jgi:hypothetical protein
MSIFPSSRQKNMVCKQATGKPYSVRLNSEDGGNIFLHNNGKLVSDYKASHLRRLHSSVTVVITSNIK